MVDVVVNGLLLGSKEENLKGGGWWTCCRRQSNKDGDNKEGSTIGDPSTQQRRRLDLVLDCWRQHCATSVDDGRREAA